MVPFTPEINQASVPVSVFKDDGRVVSFEGSDLVRDIDKYDSLYRLWVPQRLAQKTTKRVGYSA